MKINHTYVLLGIAILGFLLRIIGINATPPALNWDEVSHGYNAYSILKTGKDEWGQSFPIFNFRAYGDYPLALNLYLTIPFIWLLGLTEIAVRLPHVLLGTGTIVSSYFLFLGLTGKKKLSTFAAFLVAIDPWHLFPSRFVLQSNLSVFLLISSGALLLAGLKNKKHHLLLLSFVSLGLTTLSYHTTRIFSPLFLCGILLIYKNELTSFFKKRRISGWLSTVVVILFFLPIPFVILGSGARARANWVFLLDQGAVGKIEQERNASSLPAPMRRLIHNRPVYLLTKFSENYIGYFSPQYLFLKGGSQYQFSIPGRGVLYLVNLPFFYLGLLFVILKALKNSKEYQLVLFWLILAPIPASLTLDSHAVLRSTTMLPLPELFVALGLWFAGRWVTKSKLLNRYPKTNLFWAGAYMLLLLFGVKTYLTQMFVDYPKNYSWAWQYGYKEVVSYIKDNYSQYDQIIITKKYGEPHEFVLFFWPWEPGKYQRDTNLVRFNQSNWFWVDRFDKFYFVNDWQVPKKDGQFILESGSIIPKKEKTLLIAGPENYPKDWTKVKTIYFKDGKEAFQILTNP